MTAWALVRGHCSWTICGLIQLGDTEAPFQLSPQRTLNTADFSVCSSSLSRPLLWSMVGVVWNEFLRKNTQPPNHPFFHPCGGEWSLIICIGMHVIESHHKLHRVLPSVRGFEVMESGSAEACVRGKYNPLSPKTDETQKKGLLQEMGCLSCLDEGCQGEFPASQWVRYHQTSHWCIVACSSTRCNPEQKNVPVR